MKVIAGSLAALLTAAALAPWIVFRDELPERVATHWSLGGEPNGSMSLLTATILLTVIAATFAGLTAALLVRSPGGQWWPALLMAGVAGMIATLSIATAWVNREVVDWQDARLAAGWLGAAVGAGLAVTFATMGLMAGRWPAPAPPEITAPVAPLEVAPGDRVAWFGQAHSHGFAFAAAAEAVVGLVLLLLAPPVGVLLLALAVVFAGFATVHVTIDSSCVRVRSGTIPWPALEIPLDRIETVEVIDIRPMRRGGWGYRGSLRLFRQAGWILRRGEGLKLGLAGRRQFAVTVDDAAEAAAVLAGLRATSTPR